MLIVFSSEASGDITMFGDVALRLLKMMGMSGTVPGGIKPAEIPAALEQLKRAVTVEKDSPAEKATDERNESREKTLVNLGQRAFPLVQMLEAAAREGCHVTWNIKL